MRILVPLITIGCFLPRIAVGDVMTFTDRSDWEAALSGSQTTEDFNSFSIGPVDSTTVFPSGISLTSDARITPLGFATIGQGMALNATNETIQLPGHIGAFGFDYVDVDDEGVTLEFGSFSQPLPMTGNADSGVDLDEDFGFFGVIVDSPLEIPGSEFHFLGEEFAIDNLSFVNGPLPSEPTHMPEPTSLAIWGLSALGVLLAVRRRRRARAD